MADFTIVGGGVAGLVVARRLAMAGREVSLLEASDRLGGTVVGHTVGGIDLDAGAESFATRHGTIAALAAELGMAEEVVTPSEAGAWLQPLSGPPLPLPAASVLGIPGTPLAADVIAVLGTAGAVRAQLDGIIPFLRARPTLSLGALVRRRMGRAVLEKLVAPVVYGVHSVHPDGLALDRAVPGLRAALVREGTLAAAVRYLRDAAPAGSAVAGIRGGVHRLVAELAADLESFGVDVQLGRRVTDIGGLDGIVVIAAPGLLGPVTRRSVVLATLVVDAPQLDSAPRGTGLLVVGGAPGVRARALTHATAKWGWLRESAGGRHVVRLSYDSEPERLAEAARVDAETLLGVPLPAASVIDFARVEWLRPTESAVESEQVVLVGQTVAGPGLAGIVEHADAHARRLLLD